MQCSKRIGKKIFIAFNLFHFCEAVLVLAMTTPTAAAAPRPAPPIKPLSDKPQTSVPPIIPMPIPTHEYRSTRFYRTSPNENNAEVLGREDFIQYKLL